MFTMCVILLTVEEHLMMHHGISVVSQGHRHHMACKDLLPLIYCQYMSTMSKKNIISKGLNIIIQSVQSNFCIITKIISKCENFTYNFIRNCTRKFSKQCYRSCDIGILSLKYMKNNHKN